MTQINMIVAFDNLCGIGFQGSIPWPSFKSDMQMFKKLTIGEGNNCVVMGRKTYESLPRRHRPLKNRTNVILSRSLIPTNEYLVVRNIKDVVKIDSYDEIWIIGGESVYKEALEKLDIGKIYVTEILSEYLCDVSFPFEMIDEKNYRKKEIMQVNENGVTLKFLEFVKEKM